MDTKDSELLELAAKATGYLVTPSPLGNLMIAEPGRGQRLWNPLLLDGDALRLAVRLGLDIHTGDESYVFAGKDISERGLGYCECHNGDPLSATRRAIVRAAAEIGRAM